MASPWALLPDAGLFCAVSIGYAVAWRNTQLTMKSCPDTKVMSHGDDYRRWFQIVLMVANASRALALVIEVLLYRHESCPGFWACTVARSFPALFYWTSYGTVVVYFYQLTHEVEGTLQPWSNPLFLIANSVVYVIYAIVAVLGAADVISTWTTLDSSLFGVLAIAYFSVFCGLMYYTARVASTIRPSVIPPTQSPAFQRTPEFMKLRGSLAVKERRVLLLLLIMSGFIGLVLTLATLYYIAVAAHAFGWKHGYPPQTSLITFDAVFYALLELLPSMIILLLTRRRTKSLSTPPSYTQSPSGTRGTPRIVGEASEPDYGYGRRLSGASGGFHSYERMPLLGSSASAAYGLSGSDAALSPTTAS